MCALKGTSRRKYKVKRVKITPPSLKFVNYPKMIRYSWQKGGHNVSSVPSYMPIGDLQRHYKTKIMKTAA